MVLSNSIQQLLLVITNGRQEVHARTLMSARKSGIGGMERLSPKMWDCSAVTGGSICDHRQLFIL